MNRLPPELLKQLRDALCDAFRRKAALMQMARFALNENLDEIAGGETLRDLAFNLIQHAESHGKLQELINGALTENPTNPQLQAFHAAYKVEAELAESSTAAPLKESTSPASAAIPQSDRPSVNSPLSSQERARVRFPYDVFLSHASADKPTVRKIAEMLRDAGLTVWFDEWIIQPGDSIPRKIQQGLQDSRVLLLCMSDNAFGSDWATLESHTFLFRDPANEARRFVPLLLDDCTIPDMLAQFLYIDWRDPNDTTRQKLIEACQPATQENPEPLEPEQSEADKPKPQLTKPQTADLPGVRQSKSVNHSSPLLNVFGSGPINAVVLTPDERFIVTGASDGLVRLWRLNSLTCIRTMPGHQGHVRSVAVTSDGLLAASGANDNAVKLWNLSNGDCLQTFTGHRGRVYSVVFTIDKKFVISGSRDGTARIWNLSNGKCEQTLTGHNGRVYSVAVMEDGKRIISGSMDGTVKIWKLSSGECEQTLEGHQSGVNGVALAPNGGHIISGSEDCTVKIWNVASNKCEQTLQGHNDIINSVAITEDGKRIVSSSDDSTVKVWNFLSGECEQTLEGHKGIVWNAEVTSDAAHIISCSSDHTVKVWELSSGRCEQALEGHQDRVWSVVVTADGQHIISGSEDRTVKVWELSSGRYEQTLASHQGSVLSVTVTADGQRIISGSSDHTVKVWELSSGRCEQTLAGHQDRVWSVAVTADGQRIISGSEDRTVKVWDLSSGRCKQTLVGHQARVLSVAVTVDGQRIISGSSDHTVKVWDLATGACEQTLEGHQASVLSVAVTVDGQRIISGSSDNTVKVWELSSGRCEQTLAGHQNWVQSVAVTADGQRIISSSEDRTVRLWALAEEFDMDESAAPAVQYTNAKVVLVGDSGVGKSGLALRLTQDRWEETESTHGMEVERLMVPESTASTDSPPSTGLGNQSVEREIWLWDFAGQADYRLVHQLYMDETALALMVVNGQSDDPFKGLAHWEQALGRAVKHAPEKLLVAARCDRGGFTVSNAAVQSYCDARGYAATLQTSAKTGDGCDDLMAAIAANIPWDRLPKTSTTLIFKTLKDGVLAIKEAGPDQQDVVLMRVAELQQRLQLALPDLHFSESELRTVVRLLAGQGIVQPLDFGDFLLLQPEQINNYASAVVRCARNHTDEIGVVPERDVLDAAIDFYDMERLDPIDEMYLMRAMLQTFTERSLCLQVDTEYGKQLVFPAYFKRDRPDFPDQPTICVTYGFRGPLDEIYSTLVVRLHHTNQFEMDALWRDAADFTTLAGHRAGLQLLRDRDEEAKAEIKVFFDAECGIESQVSFIKYVHEHLKRRGDQVTRVRTFVCPKCDEPVSNQRAQKRLDQGRDTIRCD